MLSISKQKSCVYRLNFPIKFWVSLQFLNFVLPCFCLAFMLGMSLMGILNACIEEEYISWNESLLKKKWGSIS